MPLARRPFAPFPERHESVQVTSLTWELTLGVLIAFLVADVLVVARKPHTPSMRECTAYLVLSLLHI
mgnify:CR=1 FL=1